MKTTFLAAALSAAAIAPHGAEAEGGKPEWEDLAVNSVNRLPARAYAMPLADEADALTDALEPETPFVASLDGTWRFCWAGDPARRPADFWQEGFDDSKWATIDVPSCVEMRGYGIPVYTNVRYPHKNEWPKILDRKSGTPDYNPVSSYRRVFTLPEQWAGRETILRFEGVGSAFYVWVNGTFAGYAEDSKLPSEFDVTPFVRAPGEENTIAVQVFKWCDGSYLEDQDMFRFSGIFRSVSLWSRPKSGIEDFTTRTAIAPDYASATLSVSVALHGGADAASATLYAPDGTKAGSASGAAEGGRAALSIAVPGVRLWSAEKPDLYTLVVRSGGDVRSVRVGFKEQKIAGHTFLVNGRKVKFKGANRHETNPDNGRTVSLDDMLADITLMKRYNFNTVRTSHYPNHRLWYALCDRYGIYVVAEANVEGHEPGYGEEGLGRFPEWEHSIVERNLRHVAFYSGHPCVTMWSMGNETGHGDCFRKAIAAVKEADPTRPVHWERGNPDADVDSTMYPTVEWLEWRGEIGDGASGARHDGWPKENAQSGGKAFFMCEYAHAMGNAIGNFAEYWDVFYRHDSLSGGCVWDWVDQAVWKYTDRADRDTGLRVRYLAYGGDFDDEPNDGPFCVNGIVDPLRRVTPKLVEAGHVLRNLVTSRGDGGSFELWNRFSFTDASEFAGSWTLLEDGAAVASGEFDPPSVAPLSQGSFHVEALSSAIRTLDASKEHFVNFEYRTKTPAPWADVGWIVARDQLAIPAPAPAAEVGAGADAQDGAKEEAAKSAPPMGFEWSEGDLTVERGRTTAVFDRASGAIARMVLRGGVTVFDNPAAGVPGGPQLTCVRAFTDNDKTWMQEQFFDSGLSQLHYHARSLEVEGDAVRAVVDVQGFKGAGFVHEAVYRFGADGSVDVENEVRPYGRMPKALPRLGVTSRLPHRLERVRFYGRGPEENYVDRCTGSFLGVYSSTVTDQFVPYVRPQDNGFKCGVRWIEFSDKSGAGVRFSSKEPFFAQALHYGWEDLFFAAFQNGERRHRAPLVPRPETLFSIDALQTGLGGASCGPAPMDKYRFDPSAPVSWSFRIEPLARTAPARRAAPGAKRKGQGKAK